MDTLEFLRTILPDEGIYYLALFREGYQFPAHRAYTDLETMAYAVEEMADKKGLSVYHACASYQKAVIEIESDDPDKPKRKYRIPENWDRAKAFWVDIDCGQEKFDKGDGYITKADAAKAAFKFADTIGWPRPMLVDSGNGLHAYWPLIKPLKAESWRKIANVLKATLAHEGVRADPTRTADFSSILRPVGSVNRKNGGSKAVKVKSLCVAQDAKALATALLKYATEHGVKQPKAAAPSKPRGGADLNSDLTGHLSYPDIPSKGAEVASKCAQVALMRDTAGDVSYEHWRGVIGLLTHCEDGRELAEAWSAERENTGHAQTDWHTRFDTWGSGPTTCEFFEKCNPDGCTGCEFKGKVKSPIILGRVIPIAVESEVEVISNEGESEVVTTPALPTSYVYSNGLLTRLLPDKDGVLQSFPFCTLLFYPTARIRAEDGTYRIGMRMHLPNKRVRDFEMTHESMASQTDMLRAMAKYELTQSNHKDAGSHMAAYLRDQLEALKRQVEEVSTLTSFGWKSDGAFLIGDRLYGADGSVRKVLLGGSATKYSASLPAPKGTLAGYASALNFMYNRAGMEHWQYAICSGWGSMLTPMCEELFKGLLVALRGGDSGKGKTTCCYASLYAFGNAEGMSLKSKDGFTYNALWAVLGAFNNLPVLLDELTNMDAAMFSDLAYGVSNGQEKIRLTSKGGSVGFANTIQWRLSPFVTGNRDFHGLLATTQANSQAEAVRLVQINVDTYPVVHLDEDPQREAEIAQQCIEAMKANAGCAGDAMIRYVVQNVKALTDEVRATTLELARHLPDTKYRFYRAHGACTLTMCRVARDLGIVEFDLDRLFEFTVELLKELAENVAITNTVTMEDAFSRMMAELASRIIVTHEFRDARHKNGPETPRNRIQGAVAGRYVLGTTTSRDCAGYIMLNQKEVRDWCMRNRTDYNAMVGQLERDGALVKRMDKITLTRGTDFPTVQARCIIVNSYKLDKEALTLVSNSVGEEGDRQAVGEV
ncbi:MAG: hypothetical protein RJA99_3241 [Pseudomonadota bacterium]|jgi:hypothetical protein